jgi:hypothetical protein
MELDATRLGASAPSPMAVGAANGAATFWKSGREIQRLARGDDRNRGNTVKQRGRNEGRLRVECSRLGAQIGWPVLALSGI